jgi:predicted nucleic acid-binding Zn ribbon protein
VELVRVWVQPALTAVPECSARMKQVLLAKLKEKIKCCCD